MGGVDVLIMIKLYNIFKALFRTATPFVSVIEFYDKYTIGWLRILMIGAGLVLIFFWWFTW